MILLCIKLMVLWLQVWDLPSILQWWKQALVMTAAVKLIRLWLEYHQACWEHSVRELMLYEAVSWVYWLWGRVGNTQKVHRPITWVSFLVVTEATYWGKWVMTDSVHTLQRSCDGWNRVRQVTRQELGSTNKHQSLFLSSNKSLKPYLRIE